MKKNNKGFSLAELIVVVLILGILAVAITPQIMNWIDKSKVGKDQNYAGTVVTAVESVALEYIGTGKADKIDTQLELTDNTVSPSAATYQTFADDVKAMIGATKCKKPEQSGMSKYIISITQNGKTADVTCVPTT